MRTPRSVQELIDALAELPGIGPRQATRIALYLLHKGPAFDRALAERIDALRGVSFCRDCFFIHANEDGRCDICSDPSRERGLFAVVERETDVLALERTGRYKGRYFIVGSFRRSGMLEDMQRKRLAFFKERIKKEGGRAAEIIVAVNPTAAGDIVARMLVEELGPYAEKITRLGRGIPVGGEIEFADEDTLGEALTRRV